MSDSFYPTVDYDFIMTSLKESDKIIPESFEKANDYITSFVKAGSQPLYKRQGLITCNSENQVNYEQAVYLAYRFGFMGKLLDWLRDHRNWSEGGYFVKQEEI